MPLPHGEHLRICSAGLTCCTEEMEHLLAEQSKHDFEKAVRDSLTTLSQVLKARGSKFDEFFKELLANSKRDFHEMFKKTYGIIYEQNSYVFTDLFEELERYYSKGRVDLLDAMENFFNTLYQKMFTVLNSQYHFNEKYLGCVSEHMKELKPFGDVPHKLSLQLKRSFVATRTFAQALNIAGDIASNMANINPSTECTTAVMKMTQCPACRGLPDLKACSTYCINVMKGCLAYHTELDSEWNSYVDMMDKLVERLLGPFNIEMVVQPINIKISEAIMNFQENSHQVSQRVFSGCGKPVLGRKKRFINEKFNKEQIPFSIERFRRGAATDKESNGGELSLETLQFSRPGSSNNRKSNNNNNDDDDDNDDSGLGLSKLLKDIRSRVRETKQFWARLPYQMCNGESVASGPGKDDSCWNGAQKARYEGKVAGDGITNQQSNPEVTVDLSRPSTLLNEQIYALKTINNKLRAAHTGNDVEWYDTEESFGSGSGSGMPPDENDDTEKGDDDDDNGETGSGISSINPTEHFHPDSGISKNDEDNRLHTVLDEAGSRSNSNSTLGINSAGINSNKMSLNRALITYLVPVVIMWFGNAVNELIQ
ncbi:glypican dally-like [Lycorma delicatula]|uniref:glypican dally-like n=1 Tax=Lycorma delicatula TaxID=130591 RepID=UPI003F514D07